MARRYHYIFRFTLFDQAVRNCPLVASVQAGPESPLEDSETLLRSARASLQEGVKALRLEGAANILRIRAETDAVIVGLIKRVYPGSEVYITPTLKEVGELLLAGCEVIALDGTGRERPDGVSFTHLLDAIHAAGKLAMADIDSVENAVAAYEAGADIVSTTLSGYTSGSKQQPGPDFELLRACRLALQKAHDKRPREYGSRENGDGEFETFVSKEGLIPPVLVAEGRFIERWQVQAALRIGAAAVVVGGALNDPVKNTRRLRPPEPPKSIYVAAIDIGGTWVRAAKVLGGHFDGTFPLDSPYRVPLPPTRAKKMKWITQFLRAGPFDRVGISTGGIVKDNVVTVSKPTIPENVGTDFNTLRRCLVGDDPIGVIALDDGHASAWAHACHPDFAGKNVAVLAIGTGVGFGFVREGKILMGPDGEYTRINDLPGPDGRSYEELLGGAALTPKPTKQQRADANKAVQHALAMITTFLFPDVIVLCGTVGMQSWLQLSMPKREGFPQVPVMRSPFGADAGIYGAAAIALFPPESPER